MHSWHNCSSRDPDLLAKFGSQPTSDLTDAASEGEFFIEAFGSVTTSTKDCILYVMVYAYTSFISCGVA